MDVYLKNFDAIIASKRVMQVDIATSELLHKIHT